MRSCKLVVIPASMLRRIASCPVRNTSLYVGKPRQAADPAIAFHGIPTGIYYIAAVRVVASRSWLLRSIPAILKPILDT